MGIGAISSVSDVGMVSAITYRPYVYNTNKVSANSLGRVNRISDDALSGKVDYQSMLEGENTNPLKPGQSASFDDIVAMQMQQSAMNAERLLQ